MNSLVQTTTSYKVNARKLASGYEKKKSGDISIRDVISLFLFLFSIFESDPQESHRFVGGKMACSHSHDKINI